MLVFCVFLGNTRYMNNYETKALLKSYMYMSVENNMSGC